MEIVNQSFINGKLVKSIGTATQELFNPSTGEAIGTVLLADPEDANRAVRAAKEAFTSYSRTSIKERGEILQRLHHAIEKREDELVQTAILEYGSPISATIGRTRAASGAFLAAKKTMEHYDFERKTGNGAVIMTPLGIAAAITPFNANYSHICGKIAPALAAGCTTVVKPSELSALETLILCECFQEANVPEGVINVINGTGEVVGTALCTHPDVSMVSFTGSSRVCKIVMKLAADAMKRVMLELGGKSPNIILEDADLEKAIPMALMIAFSNSGQACHAGTRLIVPEKILQPIKNILKKTVSSFKLGDLQNKDTYIGPMVSRVQYDTVQRYIKSGIDEGAELLIGGLGHPDGLGGFYARPTVFVNVTPKMKIAKEEIFGPVLSVLTYRSEDEAIAIANETVYGLAAFISSADVQKAQSLARRIDAGMVLINNTIAGVSGNEPLPLGGMKQSGIGRASGVWGLEEYLEPKTVA